MILQKTDAYGGVPARQIRAALRKEMDSSFTLEFVGHLLGASSAEEGLRIGRALVAAGILRPDDDFDPGNSEFPDDEADFELTELGRRICLASLRGVARVDADAAVNKLIARATTLNAEEQFAFTVRSIHVFGSYLGNAETIGDVDVIVSLVPRYEDPDAQADAERAYLRAPAFALKSDFLGRLFQPKQDALRWLRNRDVRLSFGCEDDPAFLKSPKRCVFSADPSVPVEPHPSRARNRTVPTRGAPALAKASDRRRRARVEA